MKAKGIRHKSEGFILKLLTVFSEFKIDTKFDSHKEDKIQ